MGCFEPDVPNAANVGGDYTQLLSQYAGSMPTIFGTEAQWKPQFIRANAEGLSQATPSWLNLFGTAAGAASGAITGANTAYRGANVGDVGALGAGAAEAVRGVNPAGTALLDRLTSTATAGLAAGGQLLPGDVNRISQSVRGDWANRGLATSGGAQLEEAMQLYGAGEGARQSREALASNVAAAQNQQVTQPALALATGQSTAPEMGANMAGQVANWTTGAGPTLMPTSATYDLLNTAYNARAAAQIAGANNQAAIAGSALSY